MPKEVIDRQEARRRKKIEKPMAVMRTISPTTYPEIQCLAETLSGLLREQAKYLERVVDLGAQPIPANGA